MDIVPTILDAAGAQPGVTQDGRSLLPFAADPALRSTRPILLETGRPIAISDPASASASGKPKFKKKSIRVKNLDLDRTAQLAKVVKPPKYRAIRTPLPADQVLRRRARALRHAERPAPGQLGLEELALLPGPEVPAEEARQALAAPAPAATPS